MSDYNNKYIIGTLDVLMAQSAGEGQAQLVASMQRLKTEYESARIAAEQAAPDAQQRKDFARYQETLAKGLPNLTKGTLSAITAFKKGDAVSGSAAIMDICSTLASTIGALSLAGGPPGAVIGALFAMISQILAFFAPKTESLTSQIETMIRGLTAEEKEIQINAARQGLQAFADACNMAWERTDDRVVLKDPVVLLNILRDINLVEGNTIDHIRVVQGWLLTEGNQGLERWPSILAALCQAYNDLAVALARLNLYLNTDTAGEIPDVTREKALSKARARAAALLIEATANNRLQLDFLRKITPAARNRGMLWHIGDDTHFYATGDIRKGEYAYLGGEQRRMAITTTREDMVNSTLNPKLHVFALEPTGYQRTYHGIIGSPYNSLSQTELTFPGDDNALKGLSDVWAVPGNPDQHAQAVNFYTAKGDELRGYVLDQDNKVSLVWSKKTNNHKVGAVRVVTYPDSFPDDPDDNPKPEPSIQTGITFFVYGGCESSGEIYVWSSDGTEGYVPSPWGSYSGITVDQGNLWVFGSTGFACATHVSVMQCLKKKSPRPSWVTYGIPDQYLYKDDSARRNDGQADAPFQGLVDLSVCADGSLAASIDMRVSYTRTIGGRYPRIVRHLRNANAMYTAVPAVDRKAKTMQMTWTKIEGQAVRVQKLPIFCWPLIEGSIQAMTRAKVT